MDCKHCIYRKRTVTEGKFITVKGRQVVHTDAHIKVECLASGFAVIDRKTMKCSEG